MSWHDLDRGQLTCPRCDMPSPDGWCCMCGDWYPWLRKGEPYQFARPRGITTTYRLEGVPDALRRLMSEPAGYVRGFPVYIHL